MDKFKIFIVDDHKIFRQGLAELLLKSGEYTVVGEAVNGREAIEKIRKIKPDITFLDISMPELNGIDAINQIKQAWPTGHIIMLSMFDKSRLICESLKRGVSAYLLKDIGSKELYEAIGIVLKGDIYLCERINQKVIRNYVDQTQKNEFPSPIDILSPREREVFQLIAEGFAGKEIAGKLNISYKTVEHHKGKVFRKLNCSSYIELIRLALKENIIME